MENPPLWVWAIVVGLIIAGKFAYRWKTTKHLAKEIEQNEKVIDSSLQLKMKMIMKITINFKINFSMKVTIAITITILEVYPILELQCHINIAAINIVPVPLGTILKLGRGNYNASEIKNQNTSSLEYLDDDGAFYF